MPCNCDHLEPTAREAESVKILEFFRELAGMRYDHDNPYNGHKPYGRVETLDADTAILCDKCRKLGKKIKNKSPHLQLWWFHHRKADKKKSAQASEQAKMAVLRAKAAKKLTPAERKALGL